MADIKVKNTEGTEIASISADSIETKFDTALVGENVEDYMVEINNNFVKLLENFAGSSTPPKASTSGGAVEGQMWYDNVNDKINYKTSSEWTSNADALGGKKLDAVREYILSGLDTTGKLSKTGGTVTGEINVSGAIQVRKSIIPATSDNISLGGPNNRFRDIYLKEDGVKLGPSSKGLTFKPHNYVYAVKTDDSDVASVPKGAIILHQETGEAIIKKSTGTFPNKRIVTGWNTVLNLGRGSMRTGHLKKFTTHNDMQVYRDDGHKIWFSGGNRHLGWNADLKYEIPLNVASKKVRFTVHYYGYSMEHSGFYWYVEDANGSIIKLDCRGSGHAHAYGSFPKNCDNYIYNSSVSETIKRAYVVDVPAGARKLGMVWHHHDNSWGNRSFLYRLKVEYMIEKTATIGGRYMAFRTLAEDLQNSARIGGNKFRFLGPVGLIAGGWGQHPYGYWRNANIERIVITTPSNASSFGNLSYGRSHMGCSMSSGTRGVFQGGWNWSHGYHNGKMDYVTFATPSNATYFGHFGQENWGSSCVSDGTRGIIGPGYNARRQGYSGHHQVSKYITIETPGNASNFGTVTSAWWGSAVSSGTRGVFGGYDRRRGWSSRLVYITIQTPRNSIYFGSTRRHRGPGPNTVTDAIKGVYFGGWHGRWYQNFIEYITIATPSNGRDFGRCSPTGVGAGVSDGIRGVSTHYRWNNLSEYVVIQTPSNSMRFGTMIMRRGARPASASGQ